MHFGELLHDIYWRELDDNSFPENLQKHFSVEWLSGLIRFSLVWSSDIAAWYVCQGKLTEISVKIDTNIGTKSTKNRTGPREIKTDWGSRPDYNHYSHSHGTISGLKTKAQGNVAAQGISCALAFGDVACPTTSSVVLVIHIYAGMRARNGLLL